MTSRRFLSFATEFLKISMAQKDADIQKTLADRQGREYLQGGELPSNAPTQSLSKEGNVNHIRSLTSGAYDHKANKKKDDSYQAVRDYAAAGMRGGLTGIGVQGAINSMRGQFGTPTNIPAAAKAVRKAGALGASLALLDRAHRYSKDKDNNKEKMSSVNPNPQRPFTSPSMAASAARRTGGKTGRVLQSASGAPPRVVSLGRKYWPK